MVNKNTKSEILTCSPKSDIGVTSKVGVSFCKFPVDNDINL